MSDRHNSLSQPPLHSGDWIATFGDSFIGLDRDGVVQRIIGTPNIPAGTTGQLQGKTWHDIVTHAANDEAKDGLRHLWDAVAGGRVASDHWPATVPFASGTVAHLRRVEHDPVIAYAVHLQPTLQHTLAALVGPHIPEALQYLIQLSQGVFRGVHGPLTDPQVNAMGNIVTLSHTIEHLFSDLRAEIIRPAMLAPGPHLVSAISAFSTGNFPSVRRISTHRLGLHVDLPDDVQVYCYHTLRDIMHQILETLFGGLLAQTTIDITAQLEAATVQIVIAYNSKEQALYSIEPLHPLGLTDPKRFKPSSTLQRLVTAAQSHVQPINGKVWAEPVTGNDTHNMRIGIMLPRWQTR